MAIKTYYEKSEVGEGYMFYVYDSPAWLYHDPRPHPYSPLALDLGSTQLDEGYAESMEQVKEYAALAVDFYKDEAHGVVGEETREPVPPSERLYAIRTFPTNSNGDDDYRIRGDVLEHQYTYAVESEVPERVRKRFGKAGFDPTPLRKLEYGDNLVYEEPGEMAIIRLNDKKKGRWKFKPLINLRRK